MHKEVSVLIDELGEACRRPLYQEIAFFNKTYSEQQRRQRIRPHHEHHHQQPRRDLSTALSITATDALLQQHQQDAFETASQASSTAASTVVATSRSNTTSNNRTISGSSMASSKFLASNHSRHRRRRWDELVRDATKLVPYMTRAEQALVSRFVSILLLGFLLPHSTGNEFFLTQHATTAASSSASRNKGLPLALELSLEDRLEHGALFYNTNPTPPGRCSDAHVNLAFWIFLQQLSNFLQTICCFLDHDDDGHDDSRRMVDLLHVVAMAIDPAPSTTTFKSTSAATETLGSTVSATNKGIARAHSFMQSLAPHSFYLPYGHRRFIVKMMGHDFVLPRLILGSKNGYNGEDYHDVCTIASLSPWLEGAIYHLRASLESYAMSSCESLLADAHAAHVALANLTVQTMDRSKFLPSPEVEWNRCLARMVDRGHYVCSGCWVQDSSSSSSMIAEKANNNHSCFCPHSARGILLDKFFVSVAQQSASMYSHHHDEDVERFGCQRRQFVTHAISSLADAIEWQMECWSVPKSHEGESQQQPQDSPCLLASLLYAAKSIIFFLSEHESKEDEDNEDDEMDEQEDGKYTLLLSAIQLIHHPDPSVASQASILVSLALSRNEDISGGQQLLLESVKNALEYQVRHQSQLLLASGVRGHISLITTAARQSRSFASNMLLFIMSKRRKDWKSLESQKDDCVATLSAKWIVAICQAQPWVSLKNRKELANLFREEEGKESQSHILAAILSSRLAFFFSEPSVDSEVIDFVLRWLNNDDLDTGRALHMARHCLITGNFAVARRIYDHLIQFCVSEKSFLWIAALSKLAQSESFLQCHAAKAIPTASIELQAALNYLATLHSLDAGGCFQFIINVITLRMDFLDLITALRHFVREMRLTGAGPTKFTRSNWHVQNIPRCFEALAHRYHRLYRLYGLYVSQQSRTALRTLQASCDFVAGIARKAFADLFGEINSSKVKSNEGYRRSGDAQHPLTLLSRKLDKLVVQDMSSSVDATTRAAATLEVLDGILMVPFPFPRDLTIGLPLASLMITADPEQAAEMQNTHSFGPMLKTIEAFPGLSIKFVVNGSIPETLARKATIPFSTFLCSYQILYKGPLQELDEPPGDEKHDEEDAGTTVDVAKWTYSSPEPIVTPISPSMSFFLCAECPPLFQEGFYCLTARPMLRDIRGGEWNLLMLDDSDCSIAIRVSRLRDMHS